MGCTNNRSEAVHSTRGRCVVVRKISSTRSSYGRVSAGNFTREASWRFT